MAPKLRGSLVALVLVSAVACDGGDDPAPEGPTSPAESTSSGSPSPVTPELRAYAGEVCSAFEDYATVVVAEVEELDRTEDVTDAEVQEAISSGFQTMEDELDVLIGQVRAIDAPSVEGGERFHDNFIALFEGIRVILANTRADLAGLEGEEFFTVLAEFSDRVDEFDLGYTGEDVPPAIDNALDQDEACMRIDM